jgi:ATP-binding cassette, subfamily C (CFTR/MRP), member 1
MSFADTVITLEDGRIAQIGSPQALLASDGYLKKFRLAFGDEDRITENIEYTELPEIERAVNGSIPSVPSVTDEVTETFDARRKHGDWSVYRYYFSTSGYAIIIVFFISMAVWIFCTEFSSR